MRRLSTILATPKRPLALLVPTHTRLGPLTLRHNTAPVRVRARARARGGPGRGRARLGLNGRHGQRGGRRGHAGAEARLDQHEADLLPDHAEAW